MPPEVQGFGRTLLFDGRPEEWQSFPVLPPLNEGLGPFEVRGIRRLSIQRRPCRSNKQEYGKQMYRHLNACVTASFIRIRPHGLRGHMRTHTHEMMQAVGHGVAG